MYIVTHRNILFYSKKKISLLKVIKLMKIFLKFFPVLYLSQKNIFLNQINNIEKIEEIKFKKRFLKFK